MPLRKCFLLLLLVSAAWAAEPEIEFTGILNDGRELRVAVTPKKGGVSQWVSLGKEVAGYAIKSYEAQTDTLVVTKGTETFRLRMKDSKVKPGATELPAETKRAILNNLRQLAAASDQFFLEHGTNRVTYDQLVGPEPQKYIKRMVPVQGEDYTRMEFVQGKPIVVTTGDGFSVSYTP